MDFNSAYKQMLDFPPREYQEYNKRIRNRIRFTWHRISPLINSNSTIAEIGIGPISVLARQLKKAKVIGIDLNNSKLSLSNKFGIDLRVCDLQISPLPLEDSSIDIIMLLETVEHLCIYPNDLFDQINKKLKKEGYLIISTPNLVRFSNRLRVLSGKNPLINYFERTAGGSNHVREFVLDEMVYYLKKSGFKIVKKELFAIPSGNPVLRSFLRLIYLYPNFRNYFLIIAQK